VTAPAAPGGYSMSWQMVREGVEWFGGVSPSATVSVVPATAGNDALFVSQSVPSIVQAGSSFPVTIVFQNVGNTTWSESGSYHLGSQNPQDTATWGPNRQLLGAGESIAPGQKKTFSFNATAPAVTGSYNFQVRMVRDGVAWFGDFGPNIEVSVGSTSFVDNLVSNPSFEDGTAPTVRSWAFVAYTGAGSASLVTSGVPTGSRAVRVDVTTVGDVEFFTAPEPAAILVEPNTTYTLTTRLLSSGGALAGHRVIEWSPTGGVVRDDFLSLGGGTGNWVTLTSTFTTAWNTRSVSIRLMHHVNTGSFTWDDVVLTKTGP
jgi:hypothetical protein